MNNSLAIGDLLTRPKLGFIDHVGVYLGFNSVATNTPEKGEHRTTVQEFADGRLVKVQRMNADPVSVSINAEKVLSRPKNYDPIRRNCEHTAYEIIQGSAKSPTLVILGILALIAALWVLFRR
jgi:hypothetical protein